jgi:hypothetical protein
MSTYWFRPKRYGYGATPVTWQGWAVVAAAVAAIVLAALLILDHHARSPRTLVTFFAVEVVILAVLWVICRRRTDGEWRWRWGDR